jgi:hypothetical protein
MRSSQAGSVVEQISAGLDTLAATDMVGLDDQVLREQLLDLATVGNRVHAELIRRVDAFDRRGLAAPDGFRTAKGWLQAFGRVSGQVAHRLVKTARLLRSLPKLGIATQSGEISGEHLQQVARLVDQVGVKQVAEVDATLADAARQLDVPRFAVVCERVRAHLDPDGADPAGDFDKRTLTVSPAGGMLLLRGQLDAEGGAALVTALDALSTPPGAGDERSAGQRRADALVELARRQLAGGALPSVGGQRPQVGVLLHPQALSPATLARLAQAQRDAAAAERLREFITDPAPPAVVDWPRPGVPVGQAEPAPGLFGRTASGPVAGGAAAAASAPRAGAPPPGTPPPDAPSDRQSPVLDAPAGRSVPDAVSGVLRPSWSESGWADPPHLNWVGPIPPVLAQRIACDADIWRIILDPGTGLPLDVGRGYRLVPHWIRRALYARDRGCRWVGCGAPAEWTDAHHLDPWAEHGETKAERCLLLCRHHHVLVHEGGWCIDLDPGTGEVHITRPGGIPYEVPRTRSTSWTGPTTQAT